MVRFVGGLGGRSFDPLLTPDRNSISPLPQIGPLNSDAEGAPGELCGLC